MATSGQSIPQDIKGKARAEDYAGMNTLLQAAMASGSSTSESYLDMEETKRVGSPRTRESSTSTTDQKRERFSGPRPPRPTYTQEQEDAIRFHRDDLSMTWNQVEEAYNGLYYPDLTPWEPRTISGLQSRYYRLLPIPVNETKKQAKPRPELGILVKAPERRYWWMSKSEMSPEERVQKSHYHGDEEISYEGEDYGDGLDDDDTCSHSSKHSKTGAEKKRRPTPTHPAPKDNRSKEQIVKNSEGGQGADHGTIVKQITPATKRKREYEEPTGTSGEVVGCRGFIAVNIDGASLPTQKKPRKTL